jgi:hypothetical protein
MRAAFAILSLLVGSCGFSGQSSGLSPNASCDRYLRCLTRTNPMGYPAAQESFGPGAACWHASAQAAQSCAQACMTALADLGASCGCFADGDCAGDGGMSRCDETTGECVACLADTHCGGATPACWGGQCVACHTSADCGAGLCDPAHACVHDCADVAGCDLGDALATGKAFSCGSCAPANAYAQCLAAHCATACETWGSAACTQCSAQSCASAASACNGSSC